MAAQPRRLLVFELAGIPGRVHGPVRENVALTAEVGGAFISTGLRGDEMTEEDLESDPTSFATLASEVEQMRSGHDVLSALDLLQHPVVAKQ